eukprot:7355225-Prymnesium_polylepis.1
MKRSRNDDDAADPTQRLAAVDAEIATLEAQLAERRRERIELIEASQRRADGTAPPGFAAALSRRTPLDTTTLLQLLKWNTPTVFNGWEQITANPSYGRECFNLEPITDHAPIFGPMLGYALTVRISPGDRTVAQLAANRQRFREHVASLPPQHPKIVVVEDADKPRIYGSMWGEVNATFFKAIGAVGCITDGGVRDLECAATRRTSHSTCATDRAQHRGVDAAALLSSLLAMVQPRRASPRAPQRSRVRAAQPLSRPRRAVPHHAARRAPLAAPHTRSEMAAVGFHAMSRGVCIGHSFGGVPIEWDVPVNVFGVTVRPGQASACACACGGHGRAASCWNGRCVRGGGRSRAGGRGARGVTARARAYVHQVTTDAVALCMAGGAACSQLIHADKHGFLVVPEEDEPRLLEATEFMDLLERKHTIVPGREAAVTAAS